MKIIHPKVSDSIAAYVKGILVIENDQPTIPFRVPLFANGTPTLVFQTAKGELKDRSGHLRLFGQTILPEQLLIQGEFTLIAYFLAPHALPALFGIQANELTDAPIDPGLLPGHRTLQEKLLNAKTLADKLFLVDDHIICLAERATSINEKIIHATAMIVQNPFGNVLSRVQKEFFLTEKTFQRLFETNVGVSPNLFRRISQFDKAFQQLNNRQFRHLSDIAFENHYADQSHYIRAFKTFTGITPKEYLHLGVVE